VIAAARAAAAVLGAGLRPLLALTLLGGVVGLAWGLASEPEYAASATVIVNDRGEPADRLGGGSAGSGGPETIDRLLEIARSEEASALAAASLGGDVAGADLLARTEFRGAEGGGTIVVRSTASFPDFAAAAANAYAAALLELGTTFERRRLRRAEERLRERLSEVEAPAPVDPLDPLAPVEPVDPLEAEEEATALRERIDDVVALQELGPPLRQGREAALPTEAKPGRSPLRATVAGAGIGALLALLGLLAAELLRRPVRTPERLERALGAPTLAVLGGDRPPLAAAGPGAVELDELGADRMVDLVAALGLDRPATAPRSLAVVSPLPGEGRTSVALGVAAGVAVGTEGRVLLVEADLRRPALAELLEIDPAPGLSDYLAGQAPPREVIRSISVAGPAAALEPATLVCVTAGSELSSPAELLAGSRLPSLVDQLQRVYDLVVFDTAPLLGAPEAAVVAGEAEAVLACARAGASGARELARASGRIEASGLVGGVLVRAPHLGPGLRTIASMRRRDLGIGAGGRPVGGA
jgi:Mrp family chromosome partitioning ATPase